MKIIHHLLLVACLATEMPVLAAEPTPSAPATTIQTNTDQPPLATTATPEAATNAATTTLVPAPVPDLATNSVAGTNAVSGTNAVATANPAAPPVVMEFGTNGLRLNIHNAPLNLVLDYLSDAAGFVINKETEVRGTVDLQGKDLTKDEAVELLNSALKKNGCAVVRNGRILTIVAQDTAKISDTPIEVGNNAEEVVKGGEVVTQIIPVKYASVSQLVPNLELLLPTTATCTANESANTIILVATRTDIKRMLRIITALDTSIASVSSIKVIPLKYADAKDTATLITALFPAQAGNQGGGPGGAMGRGSIISMLTGGGFGGGGPGGRGGGAAGGGRGGAGGGGAAAAKVVAVGDDRSNSLVISAPADLVATVGGNRRNHGEGNRPGGDRRHRIARLSSEERRPGGNGRSACHALSRSDGCHQRQPEQHAVLHARARGNRHCHRQRPDEKDGAGHGRARPAHVVNHCHGVEDVDAADRGDGYRVGFR
ncbi:MAG: hypothetical protein NT167_17715 [Verrucomicrobia bacterium]|nr:hypothetical protein [Verrucomicrobiota bacterium]